MLLHVCYSGQAFAQWHGVGQGRFLVRSLVDGAGSYSVSHRAGLLPTELTGMWGWILLRSPHLRKGSLPAPAPTKQRPDSASPKWPATRPPARRPGPLVLPEEGPRWARAWAEPPAPTCPDRPMCVPRVPAQKPRRLACPPLCIDPHARAVRLTSSREPQVLPVDRAGAGPLPPRLPRRPRTPGTRGH